MAKRPRNVLFITSDQLRAEAVHSDFVKTPNLDKLRKDGSVTFMRHYANSAPCASARAALHTGTYMMNNHVTDNGSPLTAHLTNWAKEIREKAGGDPVLIGYVDQTLDVSIHSPDEEISWEGGNLPGLRRLTETDIMGSEEWLNERGLSPGVFSSGHPGWNGYSGDQSWMRDKQWDVECDPYPQPTQYKASDSDTFVLTNGAIDFINSATESFHMHLSLLKPHPPWDAPEPYNTMYNPAEIAEKCPPIRLKTHEDESAMHPWLKYMHSQEGHLAPFGGSVTAKEMDDDEILLTKSSYYALVTEMDANLGRLFEALKASGKWDDTLIVFTSDHGEMMGDNWFMGKLGFHDASFHIPLIIRDPERLNGTGESESKLFTENIDIMPTILDWLSLKVPTQCDGVSLLPIMEQYTIHESQRKEIEWKKSAHWEVNYSCWGQQAEPDEWHGKSLGLKDPEESYICSVREDRFKLVYFAGNLPPLLFDMHNDGELRNLAQDPVHQQTLFRMLNDILHWKITQSGAVTRQLKKKKINYSNTWVSRL